MINRLILPCILLVLALDYGEAVPSPIQYFKFYDEIFCKGNSVTTNQTVEDLTTIVDVTKVLSVEFVGIWRLDFVEAEYLADSVDDPICYSVASDDTVSSVTRKIPTDLNESGIMFGIWEREVPLVVTETEKSFTESVEFGQIVFTGIQNYTIFTSINFTGESRCIHAKEETISQGFGINNFYGPETVGSVRLGCDEVATLNNF